MQHKIQLLRRYVREAIDLGNTQFAPDRVDLYARKFDGEKWDMLPVDRWEQNTPKEDELYDALALRVAGTRSISSSEAADFVELINSEKYGVNGSGFFRGPKNLSAPLMRGHAYSEDWVRKNLDIPIEVIPVTSIQDFSKIFMGDPNASFKKPYVFGPNPGEGFRGWSEEISIVKSFAVKYSMGMAKNDAATSDSVFPVIFFMYPSDNDPDALLDFKSSVYNLGTARAYEHEKEVLNIKYVKCREAFVARMPISEVKKTPAFQYAQ